MSYPSSALCVLFNEKGVQKRGNKVSQNFGLAFAGLEGEIAPLGYG